MTAVGISVVVQVIVYSKVREGLNRTISVCVHHTSYKVVTDEQRGTMDSTCLLSVYWPDWLKHTKMKEFTGILGFTK